MTAAFKKLAADPSLKTCHISEPKYEQLVTGQPIKITLLNRPDAGTLYALSCGFVPDEIAEVIYTEVLDEGDSDVPATFTVVLMQTERSFAEARRRQPTMFARMNPPIPHPDERKKSSALR